MVPRYLYIFLLVLVQACQPPTECSSYCRSTYQGLQNFYNSTDGVCYAVPVCSNSQVLNQNTNKCVNPDSFVPTISANVSNATDSSGHQVSNIPIVCVHGTLISNLTCKCDSGYSTAVSQSADSAQVQMCDVQGNSSSSVPSGYVENGDGSLYAADQVTGTSGFLNGISTIYVIAGAAILCVVLCIASRCLLAWWKRRHLSKASNLPPMFPMQSYLPRFKAKN